MKTSVIQARWDHFTWGNSLSNISNNWCGSAAGNAFRRRDLEVRGCNFDPHRPHQNSAKFTLIRLPLLTSHPSICAQRVRFGAQVLSPGAGGEQIGHLVLATTSPIM